MPASWNPRGVRLALIGGGLFALAFFLRCLFLGDVFLPGQVLPFDPDSTYHLWRIQEAVAHHGVSPRFDPFMNAPWGAAVPYPDGFSWVTATIVRAAFGAEATPFQIQTTSVLLTPFWGALAALAVFPLARWVGGNRLAGWAAACFAAVLPFSIFRGVVGRVDHHVFELGLPPLVLGLLVRASSAQRCRGVVGLGVASGVLLAASAYTTRTLLLQTLLLVLALGAALAVSLRHHDGVEPARRLLYAAGLATGTAAVLVLPDALSRGGWAFYQTSWLTVALLGAAALTAGVFAQLAPRGPKVVWSSAALLAASAVALGWPLASGPWGFLSNTGVLSLVGECQPVTGNLWRTTQLFSPAFFALPLFLVAVVRGPGHPAPRWALATACSAAFLLTGAQERFGIVLVPLAAVVWGDLWARAWSHRKKWTRGLLLVVTLLALLPSGLLLANTTLVTPRDVALLHASRWLSRHAPPVGPRRGRQPSPYSVLTLWGDGNDVAYFSGRPVVSGAIYEGDHAVATRQTIEILFGDPASAWSLLQRRRVKYLVLPADVVRLQASHRRILGLGPAKTAPPLAVHLFAHNGAAVQRSGDQPVSGLGHFRLVYVSPWKDQGGRNPALKIFEVVPGAEISGACSGTPVMAQVVPLPSDDAKIKSFITGAPCHQGRFQLRLPYWGTLTVYSGARASQSHLQVSRRQVLEGHRQAVPAP